MNNNVMMIWSVIGILAIIYLPTPKTKVGGAFVIAICGPAAWASFVVYSLVLWWKGEV